MRSAYLVLGVPGNASAEEIEAAFAVARRLYTPQRLASEEGAVEKFNEVKTAYDVLRDRDSRAAHDRKLAAAPRPLSTPRVVVAYEEESPTRRLLLWGLVLAAVLFAGGFYVQNRTAQARAAQAAADLAAKQLAEREAKEKKEEAERLEQARAAAQAKAEAQDRQFAVEGQYAAQRATAERNRQDAQALQMQRTAAMEARQQEAAAREQEQRAAMEARMRVESDKRRIREMCYQLYRRYDC
jgi:curved DNA-binding protein CbpA